MTTAECESPPLAPNELLLTVRPLLIRLSRQAAAAHQLDADEVLHRATVLVLKYGGKYDPRRGRPTTFASVICRTAVSRLLRRLDRRVRAGAPLEFTVALAPGEDRTAVEEATDRGPGPDEQAARREQAALIRAAVATLPPRARSLLTVRYGLDGRSPMIQDDLARIRGVSRQRIAQIEDRALAVAYRAVRKLQRRPTPTTPSPLRHA